MWDSFRRWARRSALARKLAVATTIAAILAGIATTAALLGTPLFGNPDPTTVTLLLTLDLVLLLALGALIARRIVQIWMRVRRGQAGSRLHVRMVAVFAVLAALPAIVVAVFSTIFFYVGLQAWFSDRVRTAVGEASEVAQAYLSEHQQAIRADVLAMAHDLNREAGRLLGAPSRFNQMVSAQAALRNLSEAVVVDGTTGRVIARSDFTFSLTFEPIPDDALERARSGEVVLLIDDRSDRVRALVRLDFYVDSFLFVGRLVDPKVLSHVRLAGGAVKEYQELEVRRSELQITVSLIFVTVALLMLLAAGWFGLNFANTLAVPISALIGAAERVRAGDLAVRVDDRAAEDELGMLGRAFNRMTEQIESQRADLVEANCQLDQRRRFTETVLAGVSAGVLGLDADGVIHLPNQSAADLLGATDGPASLVGRRLAEVAPEMAELVAAAGSEVNRRRPGETQLQLRRTGGVRRTVLVRIAVEGTESERRGFIVTFDDVTELLQAQRTAAWADVARRIAHEIKNPLTPIQLSAERLRRKYLKEITSDRETFQMCTDTIVRQVGDIGRMVDEFSAFARMPSPVMKPVNIHDLCRQAVFLQTSAHPTIRFAADLPPERIAVPCDQRQISQALTNLLQNAVDAIDGRTVVNGQALPPGEIRIGLGISSATLSVIIEDNGRGLPTTVERDRLTEPYVTTRTKGTGLGLAIVKKIMEDHGGELVLDDREGGGARVSLHIPRHRDGVPGADDSGGRGGGGVATGGAGGAGEAAVADASSPLPSPSALAGNPALGA